MNSNWGASKDAEGGAVVDQPSSMDYDAGLFSILVVCTGNVCRSPLAAQLLEAQLASSGIPVRATSAGTRALVGQPMTPEAAALSLEYGGNPRVHRAQQLSRQLVENADLILTATRDHRGEVVSLSPAASRHTFTLAQFARIVGSSGELFRNAAVATGAEGGSPRDALRSFVSAAAASRGIAPLPVRAIDDDIEDPYRRSEKVYRRAGRAIDLAVTTIVGGIGSAVPER